MINLLPPQIKEQTSYAKRNAKLVRRIKLAIFMIILLGGALGGGYVLLTRKVGQANQDLSAKQQQVAGFKDLEQKVDGVNDRVAVIKKLQGNQPHFSTLLSNIAKAMPPKSVITTIELSSDPTRNVTMNAFADDYPSAVGLRDALAAMPGVAGADIQSVSPAGGKITVQLVVKLQPSFITGAVK